MDQQSFSEFDRACMTEALRQAKIAFDNGEVPVGSVLARNQEILARSHNQVECQKDATQHAEMRCLKKGAALIGDWRLTNTTLYVTLEPCSMCAGAAVLFRVDRIVFGAFDLRHGALGSHIDIFCKKHPIHQPKVEGGLMEQESKVLLQTFFKERREESKWKKGLLSSC